MAKVKNENNDVIELKEQTNSVQIDIMKQLEEIKKMQIELLKDKENFEKEKEEFNKQKKANNMANDYKPTSSNEFIEVVCNIPKFEVNDLPAYDLGTRNSNRFIRLAQYGSKGSIQFSDLQEILGYPSSGLLIGSFLIDKKHTNAIKDLGLEKMYEHIVYPEDMDEFLKKPIEEIEKIMIGCPERMKETFIEVCRIKSRSGVIDSVPKLRRIEEILNVRL